MRYPWELRILLEQNKNPNPQHSREMITVDMFLYSTCFRKVRLKKKDESWIFVVKSDLDWNVLWSFFFVHQPI